MVRVDGVGKAYDGMPILRDVHFSVESGECFGIIGPNGSGKSTLLKLLSGVESPDEGHIWLDGRPLEAYSRKERARRIAVLQQEPLPAVGFTVRDVVEMGRYPYQNWLGEERENAASLVDAIIRMLGLGDLEHRTLEWLSGGEKQRVALAKAMVQQPRLLLLDEPTTYLDIGYQVQLMDMVRAWQRQEGVTVIAVLHDLNLASLYCDRLLLLQKGQPCRIGAPREILHADVIREVYGTQPIVIEHPVRQSPQILLQSGCS
ncbi:MULTISPECIES: ABC transporter ATP-binding protein [Bacillales]|jgi:iron complex transport system ATP-binding protein|uniref:ABC transporter ATP-binding protein n=1 Tax=Brevibacillus TaxID=55080 RepID=UPI000E3A953C|nr:MULTISPECIES: ABC transporter ATP-binding protein [Bacillales]MBR8658129.1 ABC transporter ATP-binding protein [Brevibacillus sp. NL20B1]NNV01530.1 ABC transporter ATP-binding protein [Brevibacillus sp. MCWH]REK61825.1 MAG: ABC transporter ATP-binding protein [Brevibacillus sp.]UFJ61178.1 ABC transporter ATP-binding protein [Anoxybacillus sediminis]